jgi:hypothetical protein
MSTETTFETVTAALKQRIEAHNGRLPDHLPKVDLQSVMDQIMIRGATDLETLRTLDRAEFKACGVPDAIAGVMVTMLVAPTASAQPSNVMSPPATIGVVPAPAPVSPTNIVVRSVDMATEVEELSPQELLARYNHMNPGLVGARLTRLTKGAPFLGFDAVGTLDLPASLKRLEALVKGRRVGTTMTLSGGGVVRPRCVGEALVETPEHRNPCFPEEALLDDMECERTGESWQGIARDVMQLIVIEAIRSGGRPWGDNVESARSVIQAARSANAMQELGRRYKDAAAALGEMPVHEREALLTMPTHSSAANAGPQGADRGRPFVRDSAWAHARPGAVRVAIATVSRDQKLANDIATGFSSMVRAGKVDIWHPGMSTVGSSAGLNEHVRGADVVLVLMSANMFAELCHDDSVLEELRSVQRSGGIVVPVLARPCMIGVDWFKELQVLPRDNRAVSQWSDRDAAIGAIVHDVAGALRHRSRAVRPQPQPQPRTFGLLAQSDVDALKRGLDPRFTALAPEGNSPLATLTAFVEHANTAGTLDDGSVPIKTLLNNALHACGNRVQAKTVRSLIERLETTAAASDRYTINFGPGTTVGAVSFGQNARADGHVVRG